MGKIDLLKVVYDSLSTREVWRYFSIHYLFWGSNLVFRGYSFYCLCANL